MNLKWTDIELPYLRNLISETFPFINASIMSEEHCVHFLNRSELPIEAVGMTVSERRLAFPQLLGHLQMHAQDAQDEAEEVEAEQGGYLGWIREADSRRGEGKKAALKKQSCGKRGQRGRRNEEKRNPKRSRRRLK